MFTVDVSVIGGVVVGDMDVAAVVVVPLIGCVAVAEIDVAAVVSADAGCVDVVVGSLVVTTLIGSLITTLSV